MKWRAVELLGCRSALLLSFSLRTPSWSVNVRPAWHGSQTGKLSTAWRLCRKPRFKARGPAPGKYRVHEHGPPYASAFEHAGISRKRRDTRLLRDRPPRSPPPILANSRTQSGESTGSLDTPPSESGVFDLEPAAWKRLALRRVKEKNGRLELNAQVALAASRSRQLEEQRKQRRTLQRVTFRFAWDNGEYRHVR